MSRELEVDCADGRCIWRWDANAYPVDALRIRVRRADGGAEVHEVPNTGELVLPDDQEVEEIVYRGGGKGREVRWRGPPAGP